MLAASMRRVQALWQRARRADWAAVGTWSLCFGLVLYLGLDGGGYDPLVHDQVGIVAWWTVLAALLVGALPRRRPRSIAWAAMGALAALSVWTAVSLGWTESTDRTWAELARVCSYLGIFVLAVVSRDGREARHVVASIATAAALVALVGLLSRLQPGLFPAATETGRFLEDSERLSYPLDYWNGLAALVAIGMPCLLQVASCARSALARGLAAAALPAMALTLFLTLSRGGIGAAVLALGIFLALSSDRLPKLLTLLVAAAGGAILVLAANGRAALQEGLLDEAARRQGDELTWIALGTCLAVGLLVGGMTAAAHGRRPAWTRPSRARSAQLAVGAAVALLVAAIALDAPGRVADGWEEFKHGGGPGTGVGRLGSVAGQSRYQLWSAALRQNASEPLAGTGSGTFEFWWLRDAGTGETVRDTHSLYLQTLGELGVVGAILIGVLLLSLFAGGIRRLAAADDQERPAFAASIAGVAAFCIVAVFDWVWQIPVLPVAVLLLGALLVVHPPDRRPEGAAPGLPLRLAAAALAAAAIAAIAVPLAVTSLLRQSEENARGGNLGAALRQARAAERVEPGAAAPRLQQALILEQRGGLQAAAAAARAATEREATNWRNWLVLSRIEAERGKAAAAVRAYRRGRFLNPHFSLFAE